MQVDKVSILDDTIQYLQDLERKVEELESRRELLEAIAKRKPEDTVERTSDNYGSNKIGNGKNSLTNKRKALAIDEMESDNTHNMSKDGSADHTIVSMNKEDVLIEIKCLWREGILLEIMDAATHLHLDSHSVESSIIDGILSLTIKSKVWTQNHNMEVTVFISRALYENGHLNTTHNVSYEKNIDSLLYCQCVYCSTRD